MFQYLWKTNLNLLPDMDMEYIVPHMSYAYPKMEVYCYIGDT